MKLQGQKAVVTGASDSIGRAIAIGLAKEGADVAVHYRSDQEGAMATVAKIRESGRDGYAIYADFEVELATETFIDQAENDLDGIDILVNNAGVVDRSAFLELTPKAFEQVLNVNLTIPLQLMQLTAKQMIQAGRGGRFINISSIGATMCAPNRAAYSCSKAGLNMLTKCVAVELAPYDIRVNGIAPGVTDSGMAKESARQDPSWLQKRTERITLQRLGKPSDYVGAAIYLASSDSDWMTGQIMVIDGGQTLLI